MLHFTPVGAVILILYLFASVGFGIKQKVAIKRQLLSLAFVVYLLAVVKITLFPIPFHTLGNPPQNNLIPFHTIRAVLSQRSLSYDLYNLGGNVLLFVPLGFLLPLLFPNQNRLWRVVSIGFCATFVIESGKFIISSILGFTYRDFDVDDIILNTFGAFIGYLVLRLTLKVMQNRMFTKPSKTWLVVIPAVAALILVGVWGYQYESHATPNKAQQSIDSNILALETIPFVRGVVLLMPTDPSSHQPGYMAWYMTKSNMWGWRIKDQSVIPLTEKLPSGASFSSMTNDGETFAWGTVGNSRAAVVEYVSGNKRYRGAVQATGLWHLELPFKESPTSHNKWFIVLNNGTTEPMFSSTPK